MRPNSPPRKQTAGVVLLQEHASPGCRLGTRALRPQPDGGQGRAVLHGTWTWDDVPPGGDPLQDGQNTAHMRIAYDWDSLQVAVGVTCNCQEFGLPPWICTVEGNTGGSPLWDDVRIRLFDSSGRRIRSIFSGPAPAFTSPASM